METMVNEKSKMVLTPEEMFNIFMECNTANAPVKQILERYNLKPWHLVEIRKKIKEGALESLANRGKHKRKLVVISADQHHRVHRELEQAKEALAAVGHELALLKKRVN